MATEGWEPNVVARERLEPLGVDVRPVTGTRDLGKEIQGSHVVEETAGRVRRGVVDVWMASDPGEPGE